MVVTVGLEGCHSSMLGFCTESQCTPKQISKPIRNEQQTASMARAADRACKSRPLSAHPAVHGPHRLRIVQMADGGILTAKCCGGEGGCIGGGDGKRPKQRRCYASDHSVPVIEGGGAKMKSLIVRANGRRLPRVRLMRCDQRFLKPAPIETGQK